jgi:hypothetical protein
MMNTRALPFEKLVEPYYSTLSDFAAAACANPFIASILTAGMFPRAKTKVSKMADVVGLDGGFGSSYGVHEFKERKDPDLEVTLVGQESWFGAMRL